MFVFMGLLFAASSLLVMFVFWNWNALGIRIVIAGVAVHILGRWLDKGVTDDKK